jgi:hypothetical protein
MNPWSLEPVHRRCGGALIVRREHAPLASLLPYRRAAGQPPPEAADASSVERTGWSVNLGVGGLGDVLLGLGLVQALLDATGHDTGLRYHGPYSRLMQRCRLSMEVTQSSGASTVDTGSHNAARFDAVPEQPPAWLDVIDDDRVEVHAALPMRYYLMVEQQLGVRLPAARAPLPSFVATEPARPFHVVFISATSWPSRKDYGASRFARVAAVLSERRPAPWMFTLITGRDTDRSQSVGDFTTLQGLDAEDCVDVFGSAHIVIGNDTGLTHLAALTERPDGTGPHVLGLYGRHSHTKWTTGRERHHAMATAFSQMLAAADRCPVRDNLDDALWSQSADLASIRPELIADFAGHLAGWWGP